MGLGIAVALFCGSLFVMLKGADWFLIASERIGRACGLSSFIIGAVIIGLGTSFPELVVAVLALMEGEQEIIIANAIGSNVSNVLLIVGVAALIARRLDISKNLIDADLPMLAASTALFAVIVWNREVNFGEALLLITAYVIYFLYTIFYKDEEHNPEIANAEHIEEEPRGTLFTAAQLVCGVIGLLLGAKYLIDAVVALSGIFNVAPAVISITAVAIGTSLPELIVSVKAARAGKTEIAIGNIFGSNSFNALIVVGVPALFQKISVDEATFSVGLPFMIVATFLFLVSGISRRIHLWEGAMFLMIYVLFIGKLFNLF